MCFGGKDTRSGDLSLLESFAREKFQFSLRKVRCSESSPEGGLSRLAPQATGTPFGSGTGALWPQRHQSENAQGPSLLAFSGGWSSLSSRTALGPAGWLWEQVAPGAGGDRGKKAAHGNRP